MIKMSTLTMGGVTHEIVDETAREDIDKLEEKVKLLESTDKTTSEIVNDIKLRKADAIVQTISGETVTANDVSSVEHEVNVWVHGKNIFNINNFKDYTTVNYNKNSIIVDGNSATLTSTSSGGFYVPLRLLEGKTYRFKGSFENITNIRIYKSEEFGANDTVSWILNDFKEKGTFEAEYTPTQNGIFYLRFWINNTTARVSDVMVCDAETSNTEYEPWIDTTSVKVTASDKEFTVELDGSVKGISSKALANGISTNSAGVIVGCEYNVNTKTYIDQKFAELQALIQ